MTTIQEQAERWARRKADICGADKAIVTVYNMVEEFKGLIYVSFWYLGQEKGFGRNESVS